jgi:hypothetical protein
LIFYVRGNSFLIKTIRRAGKLFEINADKNSILVKRKIEE